MFLVSQLQLFHTMSDPRRKSLNELFCQLLQIPDQRTSLRTGCLYISSRRRIKVVIRLMVLSHCTASHILWPLPGSCIILPQGQRHLPFSFHLEPAGCHPPISKPPRSKKGLFRISRRSHDDSELQLTSEWTWQVTSNLFKKVPSQFSFGFFWRGVEGVHS